MVGKCCMNAAMLNDPASTSVANGISEYPRTMIVLFPQHHFFVKRLERRGHQAAQHLLHQTGFHALLLLWIFSGIQPPTVAFHPGRGTDERMLQCHVVVRGEVHAGETAPGPDPTERDAFGAQVILQ